METCKQKCAPACLFCLLLFFMSGLLSCEYDSSDENYVELKKPDEQIQLAVDLAGVNPNEIIYVYNNSSITYSLYTSGKQILGRQFYLDGVPIETDPQTGTGYLNSLITDYDIHELKLVIGLKTGSGSLAEYAMYEMYTGEFTFRIKVVPYYGNLNLRETTDANKYLKLVWDKPSDYEVTGYEIYKGDNLQGELVARITNPDETFFIDTDYAYGYKHFTVVATVKNSLSLTVRDEIDIRYLNMDEGDFEIRRISANEIHLAWKNPNPFACQYVLTYGRMNSHKLVLKEGVSEAVIPAGNFPAWNESFSLYILPKAADSERYSSYTRVYGNYADPVFGNISFMANSSRPLLYGLSFHELETRKLPSMEKNGSAVHHLELHTGCKVQVSNDGRVAFDDIQGKIHVYADNSLKQEIAVMKAGYYPFSLVTNDRLLLEERNGFALYQVKTGSVIFSKAWNPDPGAFEVLTSTAISPDAKYVAVKCQELAWDHPAREWLEIYEATPDNTLRLLETKTLVNVASIHFNPLNSTELIVQYNPYTENRFVIQNILAKTNKEIKGEYMNVDPFTGNLLYRGEEYRDGGFNLYVLSKDYRKQLIKVTLSGANPWSEAALFHSNLFFNGYYLNLSNLKEWNP